MNDKLDALLAQMQQIEKDLLRELGRKETEYFYRIEKKRVQFTDEAKKRHRGLLKHLNRFLMDTRLLVMLSVPVIWAVLIPIALLDLFVSVYQAICFPVYQIPMVRRSEFLLFDRHQLSYLNVIEKLNCEYCAYANGVFAFTTEVAARTEQYWCPIKHALRIKTAHSRYKHFFDYGDAERYRKRIEEVRRDFKDVNATEKKLINT